MPRATPFIAISRAVSRALAADEYAAVTQTFTAQQELTKAALSAAGPARLLRLLARQVDAWVVLLDPAGAPIAVHPDTARRRLPAVAAEVLRLRGHRGPVGSGFTVDEDTVSLQPVGADARRRAYLAVGKPGPLSAADRHLVNAAVMLLTLGLEQGPPVSDQVAALRAGVLELALHGSFDRARSIARQAGSPIPDGPLAVLVGRAGAGPLPDIPELHGAFVAIDGSCVTVIAPAGSASTAADALVAAGFAAGVSDAVPAAELAQAHRQAARACDAAARAGGTVQRFSDLASGGLTALLEPAQAGAFADSLLRPLLEHDRTGRGDLVVSLRTWLAHHGQWDPSAAALGVHRHTVRNRIRTAGRLLDADLDSASVRSELWLALEISRSVTVSSAATRCRRCRPGRRRSAATAGPASAASSVRFAGR